MKKLYMIYSQNISLVNPLKLFTWDTDEYVYLSIKDSTLFLVKYN